MTVYARSDVFSVTHNITGDVFERKLEKKATKNDPAVFADEFAVSADPTFEGWLLEMFPDQWSRSKTKLPLTPDEVEEKERLAEEGSVLTQQMARAMGEAAAGLVSGKVA
jgi:hypothetical protein